MAKTSIKRTPVLKAALYAKRIHKGNERKFRSMPFFEHPLQTAMILRDLFREHGVNIGKKESQLIQAALLHDSIEDAGITHEKIRKRFGLRVANLVSELTSDPIECKKIGKTAYLINKMNSISSDALLVKLCDRMNNIEWVKRMGDSPEERKFRQDYLYQTRDIINGIRRRITNEPDLIKAMFAKIEIELKE